MISGTVPEVRILFQDRYDAGRQLARRLDRFRGEHPLILALPRGGVVVGYEVACHLEAPLDVLIARKLGAPGRPELAIGAVGPGGVRVLDPNAMRYLGVSDEYVDFVTQRESQELERRIRHYRGDRPMPQVADRTVILVDDGLATGMTARAAIAALYRQRVRRLVLAVPVAAAETAADLGEQVDEVVCVDAPGDFLAVGLYYADFSQTTDEEVLELLAAARERMERPPAGPEGPGGA